MSQSGFSFIGFKTGHFGAKVFIFIASTLMILTLSRPALSVRPFVTDDARVVGEHQMQMETSVRYDKDEFTNLNLITFGPTARSEFNIGFVNGFPLDKDSNRSYSITGPLMQFKYLLWEAKPNKYPGVAFSAGASPPWGKGAFRTTRWSEFAYLAITESLFDNERVLIHANIGISTTNPASVGTWGLGTQFRIIGGFHGVAEIFYNDPYAGKIGGAYQVGFRHIVSDSVQIDMTMGSGLFGSEQIPTFVGMGIRLVSDKLW
ncbi:MAG: hypothetical protein C0392_11080 [Syntrophus sp. (in: bacteria)]|nr:hypothetical protein [Syntrophus sp. (in: bacteria)]